MGGIRGMDRVRTPHDDNILNCARVVETHLSCCVPLYPIPQAPFHTGPLRMPT